MSIILRLFGYQNLNIHWVSGLHILEPSGGAKGGEGWAAPLQVGAISLADVFLLHQ